MTTEPPQPRKTNRVLAGCAMTLVAIVLLVLGSCAIHYLTAWRVARIINENNVAAARPVIDALERYRGAAHRYPATLCDLHLSQRPAFVKGTRLFYAASSDGSQYWLAISPYHQAHFVLPSDDVNEYSSQAAHWSMMDINDTKAKDDADWAHDCRPVATHS